MSEKTSEGAGTENRDENLNAQTGESQVNNRDFQRSGRRGGSGGRHRRHNRPHQQHQPDASLNLSELRELADLINQHGFTEFEFENENIRVRLRKDLAPQQIFTQTPAASFTPIAQNNQTAQINSTSSGTSAASTTQSADPDESLHKIISPIVGTFYRAPSPGADPFVKVGSHVTPETIVCIVEAMKLMNEIPAEISGEIVKIYVENGQPVEYGQLLFAVK